MLDDLLDTWRIHNRINLFLLDVIGAEDLQAKTEGYSRSVAGIFAHIYSVRRAWIEPSAPDLLENLPKLSAKTKHELAAINHEILKQAFVASGEAIEILFERGFAKGKISGFKPHPTAFFAYLIAHEAHHRGEIGLILSQTGHPLSKDIDYAMCNW